MKSDNKIFTTTNFIVLDISIVEKNLNNQNFPWIFELCFPIGILKMRNTFSKGMNFSM